MYKSPRIKKDRIPYHIAIIMDGNGQWAKRRGLPRLAGHRAGAQAVTRIVKAATQLQIKILTLYAFSTENWKRPKKEIDILMKLLGQFLKKEFDNLNKNNIRLTAIGRLQDLPEYIQKNLYKTMDLTRNNSGLILNLALSYGGRAEIIDATKKLISKFSEDLYKLDEITESLFSEYLYTSEFPDPDLVIRTSGKMRISNFLLWQISYSEIYVTQRLWPDFRKKDLELAVKDYARRERRFGDLNKKDI